MKFSVIAIAAMLSLVPSRTAFANAAGQGRPTDQELSSLISTKIANDKSLSTDALKVTVKGGVVTLTGMVGKDVDKSRVEQIARIPGVVRVENKLTSREKATDQAQATAKKGAQKTKEALSKTGEVITDGWISSRVKTKFMGDEALRASDIKVESNDHVVTLTGAVPNAAAHAKALALAREVEGVSRVVDRLKIAS